MKIKIYTIIFGLIFFTFCYSQDQYSQLKEDASKLYHIKDYAKAAEKYNQAFDTLEGKAYPEDRYNAARAYSLSNNPERAFYHLMRLAEHSNFINYKQLITDQDLEPLYNDKRWKELTEKVKYNNYQAEKGLDKPLVALLAEIHQQDQKYRNEIVE